VIGALAIAAAISTSSAQIASAQDFSQGPGIKRYELAGLVAEARAACRKVNIGSSTMSTALLDRYCQCAGDRFAIRLWQNSMDANFFLVHGLTGYLQNMFDDESLDCFLKMECEPDAPVNLRKLCGK
jgi:hypothetical protein